MAKKREDKASALLKTMGRGSPRQQTEEAAEEVPEAATPAVAAPERKQKTVRLTVDLDAARHRRLKAFAFEEDAKNTEVMRALLDELATAPDLAERVRERLAEGG
jgi:hypothetical protein